ncbi:TIR domain-containing protein [Actinoplanes sp. NPDC026619]|uniref:KGGVGR-motif variant AAA ATPase n=1 Tax=Actinoplanes sp. NPDC026619 TaxID=3155798 RepID=UPI0033E136C2
MAAATLDHESSAGQDDSTGQIITFYSYNGGVGRTMAVANVAWVLARAGKKVLTVDWDLESPGLHRFFHPFLRDKNLHETEGVIEMIRRFSDAMTGNDDDPLETTDLHTYTVPLEWDFGTGRLDFLGAGRQSPQYSRIVSTFDWDAFWRARGSKFFPELRRQMLDQYDFVLIDSRAGLADTAGICTVEMADTVVCCFSMNMQSVNGCAAVASSIKRTREARGQAARILPAAVRVDGDEIGVLGGNTGGYVRQRFDRIVRNAGMDDLDAYWRACEIPYKRSYSYGEMLAEFADHPRRGNDLQSAYERLSGVVAGFPCTTAPIAAAERKRILAEFESQMLRPTATPTPPRAFISYVREDTEAVDRIAEALRLVGIDVWLDRTHLKAGDRWTEVIRTAISEGDYFVACFSASYAGRKATYMNEELLIAVEQLRRRPRDRRWFIPLTLDGSDIPKIPIGADETLEHLHRLDFSGDWSRSIADLVKSVVEYR